MVASEGYGTCDMFTDGLGLTERNVMLLCPPHPAMQCACRFSLPPGLQLRNLEELSRDSVTQAREASHGSGLMALFGKQVRGT